jgi:type I restriction enzyme S subunit
MPSEWTASKVRELMERRILDVNDGYRAKNAELRTQGIPFARAGNISGGFHFEDADRFPVDDLPKVGKKVSRPGDVVFTSKGTVGRFAFVRETTPRFVYSPQLCFWRSLDHEVLDPQFLYYWMHGTGFLDQAEAVKGQTDMADYVSLRDQREFLVPVLPINEQRAIAYVLGVLDDKVEANRKLNTTLEEVGLAVFEHCCRKWIDDPTSLVRCQELIDTGALVIGDGYRAKRIELAPSGLPFARAANINDGFRFENAELLGEPGVARAKHKASVPGDVVFTSKGTVGRFAFVSESTPRFVYSPQLCFWRSADTRRLQPTYLLYWMRSRSFLEQVDAVKGQTDMADYVSLTDQRQMQVAVPPESLQAQVARSLDPIQEHCALLVRNSQTLAQLRDVLLPRLLSGELRARQAEKLVEEAI